MLQLFMKYQRELQRFHINIYLVQEFGMLEIDISSFWLVSYFLWPLVFIIMSGYVICTQYGDMPRSIYYC